MEDWELAAVAAHKSMLMQQIEVAKKAKKVKLFSLMQSSLIMIEALEKMLEREMAKNGKSSKD